MNLKKFKRLFEFFSPAQRLISHNGEPATMKSYQMILTAVAAVSLVGCVNDRVDSFDPRGPSQAQGLAAAGLPAATPVAIPQTLNETIFKDDADTLRQNARNEPLLNKIDAVPSTVRVGLREAIQRLVVANLDVKVAGYTPAIDETRVTEAEGRFDPTLQLSSTVATGNSFQQQLGGLFGNNSIESTQITNQIGIRQLLQSGGEATLQYRVVAFQDSTRVFNNPAYLSEVSLQLTQPLLRDFGNEINRARIVINRNNQHVSILEFRTELERQIQEMEQVYWQLVQAQKEVEIYQLLLQRTVDTAILLSIRKDQDVTAEQLSQANAEVETRRSQLIRSLARVADFSDQLKRFINDPSLPVAGPALLLPSTTPVLTQVIFDPTDSIRTGLLNRAELGQQQLRVDNALVALGVAKNNLLPRLDLVFSGALQGSDDEFGDALSNTPDWNDQNFNASLGFQFEIPLGNRVARAILRRAQLQQQQAIDQFSGAVLQVSLDVKQGLREVETTYKEIARATAARLAQERALEAIQVREDQGEPLTPQFVDRKLRAQAAVADAQLSEARSISAYNVALSQLERAKGTLLRYNNIVLQEDQLPAK